MAALEPDPLDALTVAVRPQRSEVVVLPAGPLDLATVDTLEDEVRELRDAGFTDIVLDLRGVTFLDSCGLQVLLSLRNAAKRARQRLTLIPARPEVQRIFALTMTRGLFDWRTR